jgi:hypothetical protein
MQKVIALVVIVGAVLGFAVVGCETTDPRVYGRWQADVTSQMPWMNNQGSSDLSNMTAEEIALMQRMRQRMANRRIVFDFKDDATWTSSYIRQGDEENSSVPAGMERTGTYSIQDKDEKTVTIVLHEFRGDDRKLKVRFTANNKFALEAYEAVGGRDMTFGEFQRE